MQIDTDEKPGCVLVLVSVVLHNSLRVNQERGTLSPSLGTEGSLVAKR